MTDKGRLLTDIWRLRILKEVNMDPGQKETHILALTEELKTSLRELDTIVCNLVNRVPEKTPASEEKPVVPNVFDEIFDNLTEMRGQIRRIQEYVLSGITNKVL